MRTPTETTTLELVVCWGDDVLQCRHLTSTDTFTIGSGSGVDFVVPDLEEPTQIALQEGVTQVGDLSFHVTEVQTERSSVRDGLFAFSRDNQWWLLGSFLAHAGLLAAFALTPPSASALSLNSLQAEHLRTKYTLDMLETEALEMPPEFLPDEPSTGDSGAREKGDEGAMGDDKAPKTTKRYAIKGPKDNVDEQMSKHEMIAKMDQLSILGALRAASGSLAPTSIYGSEAAIGSDPISALGALLGDSPGLNLGKDGLGMVGTGRHGGGDAEGTIGLDRVGTIGSHGPGNGPGPSAVFTNRRASRVPRLRVGKVDVAGSLSKETIRRVINRQRNQIRYCYEQGLVSRPDLGGRVAVKFIVSPTGAVQTALVATSTMGHKPTEQCIAAVMRRLDFPAPDGGGMVVVTYPFVMNPVGG